MGLLQNPDVASKLARQYGIRGIFSPELVPSLQPTVLIDDLTAGISNEPQRIAVAQVFVLGVNAEFTIFRFETPPGVIAQIEEVFMSTESNQIIEVFFGSFIAAPAALAVGALTDGRLRSQGQVPACILGGDTFAAKNSVIHNQFIGTSSVTVQTAIHPGWVVGRTDGANFDFLEMSCRTLDQNVSCSMRWREFDASEVR